MDLKNFSNKQRICGFTLIETIVAIAILFILCLCLCQVFLTIGQISKDDKYKKIAIHLAKQKLEELFHYGEEDFDEGDFKDTPNPASDNNSLKETILLPSHDEIIAALDIENNTDQILTDQRWLELQNNQHADKNEISNLTPLNFRRAWLVKEKTDSSGQGNKKYKIITCIVEWEGKEIENEIGDTIITYNHIYLKQKIYDLERLGVDQG